MQVTEDIIDAGDSEKEDDSPRTLCYCQWGPSYSFNNRLPTLICIEKEANEEAEALRKKFEQETKNLVIQAGAAKPSSTNIFSTVSTPAKASSTNLVNTVSISKLMADFTNLETVVNVSPIPTSRIHSSHPSALILGDPNSAVQTRSKVNTSSGAHAFKISEALEDESWVDAMQEELLQFKIQKVWVLVDLPYGKKAIGTKWVYQNKKDERGIVFRNKARLVAQGHKQEEGIDYDESINMRDVDQCLPYGKIDEEVYVSQPPGFLDPKYPQKVYKVVKALYGLHQAPRGLSMIGDYTVLELASRPDIILPVYAMIKVSGNLQHEVVNFLAEGSSLGNAKSRPLWLLLLRKQNRVAGCKLFVESIKPREIQLLKAQITKLKKQAKPVTKHHRAWLKSVSLKQRLTRKSFSKKQKVQKDPLFDEIHEDTVDHMETENAQDVGRTRELVDEEMEIDENILTEKKFKNSLKSDEEMARQYKKSGSEVIKEESKEEVQEESKEEENTRKRKLGTRKKIKSRKKIHLKTHLKMNSEERRMMSEITTVIIAPDV
ncbi:putative ribonuclease H-like domain-containing protein [Tanacetum coccineum]|uniref:Ribonuclease H-like domain-containing protein n=1 Tax=Tanacetum coccineum TaxID=301880 RepID=A0ABQ5B2R4_9ASTR